MCRNNNNDPLLCRRFSLNLIQLCVPLRLTKRDSNKACYCIHTQWGKKKKEVADDRYVQPFNTSAKGLHEIEPKKGHG